MTVQAAAIGSSVATRALRCKDADVELKRLKACVNAARNVDGPGRGEFHRLSNDDPFD